MIPAVASILLLISAATSSTLSLIIFFTKQKKPVSLWIGVIASLCVIWTLGVALFLGVQDDSMARFFVHTYYVSALLIPYALYFFSLYYPYTRIKSIFEPLAYGVMVALVSILVLVPGVMVQDISVGPHNSNTVSLNLWIYGAYSLLFASLALKAFVNLIMSYRRTKLQHEPILSRQIHGIIIICATSLAGGSLFTLLLP